MRDALYIRVLRLLLLLYPARFRVRFGAEILANARTAASSRDAARPGWVLADAVITLVRAWLHEARGMSEGVGIGSSVTALGRDGLWSLRTLRRRPMHGAVIVLTLAIALGANSAIYTVAYALLLDRLPYDSPAQIVDVTRGPTRMIRAGEVVTWAPAGALVDHPGVEVAATYYPDAGANLVAGRDASRVRLTQVSAAFFEVLGVRMLLGTGIDDSGEADVVLSYGLWRSAFGGDPEVVGHSIQLNGRSYRITGVAPRSVEFPAGTQLWVAEPLVDEFFGSAYGPSIVARLRPGALTAVQRTLIEDADVRRADAGDAAQYITDPELVPLRAYLTSGVRLPLAILAAAAATLLLLGCVNVAGVSVARVAARAPELAMRRALGASRIRLFGQLLTELSALALLAGVLSAAFAAAAVPVLVSMLPGGTPGLDAVQPGALTLIFTAGATAVAALVAGVPPAIAGVRGGGASVHPDRLRSDDPGGQRLHGFLTSVQVALAVVLVVTASLLARSLAELRAVPLGFSTEQVLTFSVRLPMASYTQVHDGQTRVDVPDVRRYTGEVQSRLGALPGVSVVGVTDRLPLAEGLGVGGRVRRAGDLLEQAVTAGQVAASDEFFDAMGIRLLQGRSFQPGDDPGGTVILSAALARGLLGGAPAVGAVVTVRRPWGESDATVIGVADDTRRHGVEQEARPVIYSPFASVVTLSPAFVVRTAGPSGPLIPAVRAVLAEVDPAVAPHALRTTGDAVGELLAARRAAALIASLFGGASLLLAIMAVYTLLAHGVVRRRREIGIRVALGAKASEIERLVVGRGLAWTSAGIAAGLLLSIAASQWLQSLLFGVAPRDPKVLVATALTVLAAALLASWLPARHACRADPLQSLREG